MGRNRPTLIRKNWLVHRLFYEALVGVATRAHGRLIDVGCGTKPYEELFKPYVSEHIGVDHAGSLHSLDSVDIVGSAYEVPAADGVFNTVLCTFALEHLEHPQDAVKEARRLLAPGGIAIYGAPFIWHLHEEPRDFFRYTKYGLRHLFETAGFHVEEIRPLSGFWVTFIQLFCYWLHRGVWRWVPVVPLAAAVLQTIAYIINRFDSTTEWTWAYLIIARVPDD